MDQQKEANGQPRPLEDVASEQYSALPTTGDRAQLIPGQAPDRTSGSSVESGTEVSPLQMELGKQTTQCRAEGLKVIIISAISFSVALTVALILTIYFGPPQVPPHGAVACDSPVCAAVGTDILKKGGSAVDAAIATTFCLTVVHPFSASIGGGGFLIMRDNKKNHSMTVNMRETAPKSRPEDYIRTNGESAKSAGMTVAVPGLLRGLELAHKEHGKLAWSELIQPSIIIANDTGFNVSRSFAESLNGMNYMETKAFPALHQFLMQHGRELMENDTVYNHDLADTLDIIAREGASAFYDSTIAGEIYNAVETHGGIITEDDLKEYTAIKGHPHETTFNGSVIQSVPAPAGGDLVLMILNLLQAMEKRASNGTYLQNLHWFIEAQKFADVEAGHLGDPSTDPAVNNVTSLMIRKKLAQALANVSEARTQDAEWYSVQLKMGLASLPDRGTCTVSVIGAVEDMVTISLSNGRPWGSKIMTKGIILNDQMNSFSEENSQNPFNKWKPGKRPLSLMAPSVVFSRNKPCGIRMAVGGSGGKKVPAAVAQVISNTLQYGLDVDKAIQSARAYADLLENKVYIEASEDTSVGDFLTSLGHQTQVVSNIGSCVNAAAKINETVRAFGDRRNGGGESVF